MLKTILDEKKEENYSHIKYILSGGLLLSGINIVYPLFLISKILGTAICTSLGGLGGQIIYNFSYDNYYKKCVLYKYNKSEYNSKYIEDHVFREQMFETYELSIQYVTNVLTNILTKDHILTDCFNDMKENWFNNKELDDINHILNYYFFAIYNYFYFLKKQDIVQNIDLPNIVPYCKDNFIIPNLFSDYNLRTETLLKIYISSERLIFNSYYDSVIELLNNKFIEENDNFCKNCKLILKDTVSIETSQKTNKLWIEMFQQKNIYDKINKIYEINQQVVQDNKTDTIMGADDIMPLMIDSLCRSEHKYIYTQYMFFKNYYNGALYRDIFEFLNIKFISIAEYIINYNNI